MTWAVVDMPESRSEDRPRFIRPKRARRPSDASVDVTDAIRHCSTPTEARWKHRRIEHMAALRCLRYGDHWDAYWEEAAG